MSHHLSPLCAVPLPGAQTAYGTQLTNAEVDELFSDLSISEHDVIDYEQFVLALTSGFVQLSSD
jgi:hypothetical protein